MPRNLTLPRAGEASGTDQPPVPPLSPPASPLSQLPSVDRLLGRVELAASIAEHGQPFVKRAVQQALAAARQCLSEQEAAPSIDALVADAAQRLAVVAAPRLSPVFNLTGTVIHTNLGRALLSDEVIDAVAAAMRVPVALEYDIAGGGRGDRDDVVADLLRELTGAEAATVVNNNAAAVVLMLRALAARKEVVISRGELIEIGGAFRMPEIMKAAGCKLVEVGTTNRTHAQDYIAAIGEKTALVFKAHASNYAVTGFTASVSTSRLAALAHARGVPFAVDLGAGALLDLTTYGLPKEPTPDEILAAGADLVTFSGDKLLGGPQAGLIVGRKELIARLKKNPLKRALRVSKMTVAALEATLRIYASGHRLLERLPTLALLVRGQADIAAACARLRGPLELAAGAGFAVRIERCASQIGSGSQPVERLQSAALVVAPVGKAKGRVIEQLEARLRAAPIPVLGRIHDGALWLDARCLLPADEERFVANLEQLSC